MRHLMTRHGCLFAVSLFAMGLLFAGCSPWATYPPVEVKAARMMTRETFEPVPTVMALAIDYVRREYTAGKDLAINLPAGTGWQTYDKVFKKTTGDCRPMTKAGEPAITIQEVRTRGYEAEVDVVYPRADGLNQLATLTLHRDVFKDWKVESARLWQIRDVQTPEPNYVPPTGEELAKKKMDHGPGGEQPASQPAK